MPRLAQIVDGKVRNLVEVPHHFDHTTHEALAEHIPVPEGSDVVVGHHFDAKTGSFRSADIPKDELIGHAVRRYREQIFAPHKLSNGQIVSVEWDQRPMLARLVERARRDPQFSIPWPMYREDQPPLTLSAAQLVELNDLVTDWEIATLRAYKGVMDDIERGNITTHLQVDNPTAPAWPARFRAGTGSRF